MTRSSNGLAVKRALVAAARALNPPAANYAVYFGYPGDTYPDEAVAFTDTRSTQDVATMSTRRTRDETIEQDVLIVVTFQGSSDEAQEAAEARAYALLGGIEDYCRATDTTLGGSVLWCTLTSHNVEGYTPAENRASGYACQISATFTARARITTP